MNLLMLFFFGCVAIGLAVPRFGRREGWAVGGVAALVTVIYYLFPVRFM
jgi:hypothetical protein